MPACSLAFMCFLAASSTAPSVLLHCHYFPSKYQFIMLRPALCANGKMGAQLYTFRALFQLVLHVFLLCCLSSQRIYEDGETIVQQGSSEDHTFFVVAQGEVVASVRRTAAAAAAAGPQSTTVPAAAAAGSSSNGPAADKSVHGGVREVLTMGPGAFFGERSLTGQFTWAASMITRGKVCEPSFILLSCVTFLLSGG